MRFSASSVYSFFIGPAASEIYTLSLHDALPICQSSANAIISCSPLAARSRPKLPATSIMQSRSEEHTSELQSRVDLVCRLLLEKKKTSSHHDTARWP